MRIYKGKTWKIAYKKIKKDILGNEFDKIV